jgi:DNA-binding winged helix-turn-helix (wHTH) protein
MTTERAQYVRFLALPPQWAAESGLPPEMVLRHLCEWTVVGAFPQGALVTSLGSEVAPLSIFEAFRAITNQGEVHLGGWSWHIDPAEGFDRLNGVLVTTQDVLKFCETTNTLPPRSLLGGVRRLWALINRQKHLAPPPCPDAEEHARRQFARGNVIGTMNTLRGILAGLQGQRTAFGPRRIAGHAIDFDFWGKRWERTRNHAHDEITACRDAGLQQELDSLEAGWRALVEAETRASAGSVDNEDSAATAEEAIPQKKVVRLCIKRHLRLAAIDGEQRVIAEQPLKLLCLLAENAKRDNGYVSNSKIEDYLWGSNLSKVTRTTRDVIRDLRDAIAGDAANGSELRGLIETRTNLGYRLALKPEEIELED